MSGAADLLTYNVRQQSLSYKAGFAEPQFTLGWSIARSFQILYSRLIRYGMRLTDLKAEGSPGNPADFAISCWLPSHNTLLKFRLENIELSTSSSDAAILVGILQAAIEGVKQIAGDNFRPLIFQQLILETHGLLPEQPVDGYLARYTKVPAEPGVRTGGVGFNLGASADEGRLTANVVIAPSAIIEHGLYLQVNASWGGSSDLKQLQERFTSLVSSTLGILGLKVE